MSGKFLQGGSGLDPALVRAYQAAEYVVECMPPFTLRIGQASDELAALHRRFEVPCSVFITAVNPRSRALGNALNRARLSALERTVAALGLTGIAGSARDPGGLWPDEDSLLVPGLDLSGARALGTHWEQNAIVWSDASAIPRLVLLR